MWFRVFVVLAVLFRVGLFLYFVNHGQYIDNDSALYITLAENLLTHHGFSESLIAPYEPEIFRTPGYPVFLAILMALGMDGPNWTVFWQELIYGFCIFIFYRFGRTVFDPRIMRLSLIFLLLEPGGLVYPKLIMSELVFLPFFLGAMLAIAYYLRNFKWHYLFSAGVLFGLGALIRPAVLYFPMVVCVVLLCVGYKNSNKWLHAGVLMLSFMMTIAPWLIRNHHYFGEVIMTGSKSNILINYHVPIVLADAQAIPRAQATAYVNQLVQQTRQEKQDELSRPLSATEGFHLEQEIAVRELAQYPGTYLKQWIYGSLKTMNGPFITQLYDSLSIRSERVHFADAVTRGFLPGLIYYFKNLDLLFLINLLLTMLMSGFALLGIFGIFKSKDPFLWIMMLANFYFICLPGPEGYPRFRFPIGVFWFIQACLGFEWTIAHCQRFWQKKSMIENQY
jgi:4-amino-4-deoxy-L-arabinose transferase-like glycosyltransferase